MPIFSPSANVTGIFTQNYSVTGLTITSGGTYVLAHGLGAVPELIQCRIASVTLSQGYSPGNLLYVNPNQKSYSVADQMGFELQVDSTNIYLFFGSAAQVFYVKPRNSATDTQFVNNADWRLTVKAWA